MNVRNIVFPTDFSEPAGRSLPHALAMAEKFDSQITVLHVLAPYGDDPDHTQYLFVNVDRYGKYVNDQLQRILNEIGSDYQVNSHIISSTSPALGILHYLEQHPADVVVMGTHGRSALGRFFLGTVAEKVARHATCPVLTVACQRENYRDNPSFQKILVPFDFSEYSIEAVRKGRKLSSRYGAELQVLHILTQQIQPQFQKLSKKGFNGHLPTLPVIAREALEKTLREEGMSDLIRHVTIGEEYSRAAEGIVDYAQKYDIDLIVIGRHGLTGIEDVLPGSTTERVIRTAPCPVLTIHKPQKA